MDYIESEKMAKLIYEMLLRGDEILSGSHWEEVYASEYDTFASILKKAIDIFLDNEIVDFDDDFNEIKLGGRRERLKALITYLKQTVTELSDELSKGEQQ